MFRIKMAKGTKVSRATSLVTSMELKKGSSTSMSARKRSVFFTAKQAQRQRLEQTAATQPGHDGHQAEKQAQHAEVEIGNIRRGGRHKRVEASAASAAQQRTASLRIKFKMRAGEMHGVRFLS